MIDHSDFAEIMLMILTGLVTMMVLVIMDIIDLNRADRKTPHDHQVVMLR